MAICDTIKWSNSVYDLGYINGSIFYENQGLLQINVSDEFPFTNFNLIISSDCIELYDTSPNWASETTIKINPGFSYYIPFRLRLLGKENCGRFNCEVKYTLQYEINGELFECTGSTNVTAYNAICDFQKCLLQASEAYCTLDLGCETDICKDPCYQRFVKLFLIDQIIRRKSAEYITNKDYLAINNLYKQALEGICNCDCNGNPKPDSGENFTETEFVMPQ